jgi:alpha-galactosidase/6-phospho-beta-glucosidase family protein
VLDSHELSARAAVECDRELLYRAFVCDPLVSSLTDSRTMIDELLEREASVLPEAWGK